ncbi:class I SAM-dependent methyltransferase [Paenibacillus prosopidis]|uniref:Methyltransferase family protein n=1 Tax=Paenibacillus prosopidis TaxID=630520 RepID=A0A368W555_9BACL|nr:class I SAM-dependent methyltransferase [Paenibacillus prosopidis]RCW50893.1 methyltransferase family protein [Paenibacillus prosopidis]
MQRFWEKIVGPILQQEQPKTLVEIGALYGENTVKLLHYAHQNNAVVIVIDPFPAFHESQWGETLRQHMILLREYSLDVLPRLQWYDAILIDGDHNWYTVYHELKEVEKFAQRTGAFPLIFLHDTEWPYGRRDLYHNPSIIPIHFRQPYAQKGIVQGVSQLVDHGFNSTSFHAIHENGPRNGVMTAIEDFLRESTFPLSLHRAHSNNGLAIISLTDEKRDAFIKHVIQQSGL